MFGLFKNKTLPNPHGTDKTSVAKQIEIALKSFTLPQLTPQWRLYAQYDKDWNTHTAISEGYNASAVVYACVEKRAKLVAAVPFVAQRRNRDGEWETQKESELQRLLDRPNPDQSDYEWKYEIEQQLCLSGNCYNSQVRNGQRPSALWVLPAQYTKIKPGKVELIDYYEYDESGNKAKMPASDVVHLRLPNPNSRYFGMPVLMAAGRATDIDRESGIWQKTGLQNRGAVDVHIEVPDGTPKEARDDIRDNWQKRQSGPKNARKPIVSPGKVNYLGMTALEMDFVESRKAVWTEIAACFGVPLAMLGFTEDVNLANAGAMKKAMYEDTIIPELDLITRQLTHQLAHEFGREWRVHYDLSNIEALQENEKEKAEKADRYFRMGVPFNVINERLQMGFDDIKGGDIGYLPAGLIPTNLMLDDGASSEDLEKSWQIAYGTKDNKDKS